MRVCRGTSVGAGVAAFLLAASAACGDATGPPSHGPPPEPPVRLLLARTVEWAQSEPADSQIGEYEYDAGGRLVQYRFSHNWPDGQWRSTIRIDYLYQDEGRMLGWDFYVRLPDSTWWQTQLLRYTYGEAGHPSEAYIEWVDDHGEVRSVSRGYVHNRHGQVVEERQGPETVHYTYDDDGDVTRIRFSDIRFAEQLSTHTYSDAWNPFYGLPPAIGVVHVFGADMFSAHVRITEERGVTGEPPASRAEGTVEVNDYRYPVRRDWTTWNTADPDIRMTVVTTFEYHSPPQAASSAAAEGAW